MHASNAATALLHSALELTTGADVARELGVDERTVRRWAKGEIPMPSRWEPALSQLLRQRAPLRTDSHGQFNFIDLFAGVGGIRQGFESVGGHCVFSSEWDRFALQTYRANFGNEDEEIQTDIRQVTAVSDDAEENSRYIDERIPEHDVLLAGFPCQPFSLAGVSKKNSLGREHGFLCEAQGTLFFDVARIIEVKRPRAFLLENVKNLRSHDGGRTYEVIRRVLEELGYQVHDRVIDGKGFVPQHRERIYMVGFRKDTPFTWNQLDFPPPDARTLREVLHREDGSETPEPPYTEGDMGTVGDKYILSDKLWKYLQDYRAKHERAGNGFGYSKVGPEDTARTLSARYHKDGSEILVDRGAAERPRRLTPRECARLMGFDDSFRIPVSDTQAYRQFGNSVVVPVIREIASAMVPHVLADIRSEQEDRQVELPMEFRDTA
ncbi:DNA (cytosine-5-)-methyltransferase [Thioalkalivibrio sp. ALE11]|uniref:DNA (cytosine-5-)-methyltransferase n=1 Tax=Thioalkalivibrio sp. ALE11 TaxID=1265494 RepID=UPI000368ACEC|nr:DNA (cytosine-5-)-methyltransferase [Thioalkalivibrio sp. ALE11]